MEEPPRLRRLGVVGTMVWDTIRRDAPAGLRVDEWGGICYALAAADAIRPSGWCVRPIIKLGRDLAERGFRFLAELSVVETVDQVAVVPDPNPRVELHYTSSARRCERISGGLPTWSWDEIESRLSDCDALYVNFITGHEFGLDVAQSIRRRFDGPIYADVHSLLLATGPEGERSPRPLARWADWLKCFDIVQLNEDELGTLAAHWGDPWRLAADVVGRSTRIIFVTLGPGGAAYVKTPDALPIGSRTGSIVERAGAVETGRVATEPLENGDPTGCGDIWGISCFCTLLEGRDVREAMAQANRMAARNFMHRGASGLNRFLRGELEHG